MNASGRLNTCKSRGNSLVAILKLTTGKRVRNTCETFPYLGNSPKKFGLIPHNILLWHHDGIKTPVDEDGRAYD